jgi:hypothetical protein
MEPIVSVLDAQYLTRFSIHVPSEVSAKDLFSYESPVLPGDVMVEPSQKLCNATRE